MLIICPGIHDQKLTQSFVSRLLPNRVSTGATPQVWILPPRDRPYFPPEIWQFLHESGAIDLFKPASSEPLIWIGFSAGVVGAIGAAWGLYSLQYPVKAFIAIDGWGVPLFAPFPIHRVSHDYFTHWSSAVLGRGCESFYADPPVEHLALWNSPESAIGWHIPAEGSISRPQRTTAAEFVRWAIARG
ncbi:MAG TPA: hypothetical protein V6D27_08845 [Vampirovibrionales bacterium]